MNQKKNLMEYFKSIASKLLLPVLSLKLIVKMNCYIVNWPNNGFKIILSNNVGAVELKVTNRLIKH